MTTKGNPNGPNLSTHTYGGTRMGDNPDTSVVDKWGFSHEAPNLGMLGGSVFGTSGARNPTLTIQALAWRTAERLAKNWKLSERMGMQFAWDVYNVTNSVRFDVNPLNSLQNLTTSGSFGVYGATLTTPRVQQLSLRFSF